MTDPAELRTAYVEALVALDARRARALIAEASAQGMAADTLYLEVLAPALEQIGERWEHGEITVGHEHLATAVTSSVLAGLAAALAPAAVAAAGRALVTCTAGEQHAVGGQMVADFLGAAGWTVDFLGTGTPPESIAHLVADLEADVVALSTALPWNLPAARRTVELLRELPGAPRVIVGGRAYAGIDAPADHVGADGYAASPAELLELVGR